MKYVVRINKRVKYLRTYNIVKRVGGNENLITKMFVKLFNRKKNERNLPL